MTYIVQDHTDDSIAVFDEEVGSISELADLMASEGGYDDGAELTIYEVTEEGHYTYVAGPQLIEN